METIIILICVGIFVSWPFLAWKYFKLCREPQEFLACKDKERLRKAKQKQFEMRDKLAGQISDSITITTSYSDDFEDYDDGDDYDKDSWEGGFWDAENPKKVTSNLEIEYRDGNGDKTKREISVREFDNDLYGGIIMAHCHLRNATRTFRFDRIISAVDTDSGEVIPNIKEHLLSLYHASPLGTIDVAIDNNRDAWDILFYLAKTDGRAMPKEKEVIAEYYRQLTGNDDIEKQDVTEIIGKHEEVRFSSFKKSASKIKKHEQYQKVLKAAKEMVAASKTDAAQDKAMVILNNKSEHHDEKERKS